MILVIAEKKELAKAIADAIDGTSEKEGFAIKKGDYIITYLGGHAMELVDPEEIDEKYSQWRTEDLPIYFYPWARKVKDEKIKMVADIGEYLNVCQYVIHAGDNDDEGQLLVDEVLEHFGYAGKVLRLDTGNTTKAGLQKALSNMTDNDLHKSAGLAAYARAISDKAFGYSLSRHFTILNKVKLNVGRVQTPTLGLVVERDRQIENHEKIYYYNLFTNLQVSGSLIRAKFEPSEDDPILTDGKCLSKQPLEDIKNNITGKNIDATVIKKEIKEAPPLPFNLVKLQSYCDKKWGYSPQDVMEITQSLRDNYKAITYNRSDCQYLTEEHYAEAPLTVAATLQSLKLDPAQFDINTERKTKAFNDKYVKLHFAIIPSGQPIQIGKLSERERNVYTAIAIRYLMQFAPETVKERTALIAESDFGPFTASETVIISVGWRRLDEGSLDVDEEESAEDAAGLSKIPVGTYKCFVNSTEIKEAETKPPKRYTQASLNEDLTRIVKYVTDPKIKELLLKKDDGKKGENGSIGTTATRAMIIDNLIKRGYLAQDGKNIISTHLGRVFYNALPDEIKKADTTALWYAHQEAIIDGTEKPTALTESVLSTINHVIATCTTPTITLAKKEEVVIGNCPVCGADVIHVNNKKLQAYKCKNENCDFIIWEKSFGSQISPDNAKRILDGKSTITMSFKSNKTGKPYKGKLKLSDDKKSLEMEFVKTNSKTK